MKNNIDYQNNEALNIVNVAVKCGIEIIKPIDNTRILAKCPFCDDRSGHLYLTLANPKGYYNVYKCIKCGEGGSAVKLYSKMKGYSDNKEAFKALMSEDNSNNVELTKKIIEKTKEANKVVDAKDISYLNKVYIAFLEKLNLNTAHNKDLVERGLDEISISTNSYKSIPYNFKDRNVICEKLIKEGFTLEGVPGFFTDKYGKWSFAGKTGYLIPIRNLNNEIISLQIRLDHKEGKLRYKYFSSVGYNNGCKAIAGVHYAEGTKKDRLYVTEGPLKADVSRYLSGYSFLAIPGVNAIHEQLIDAIKELGYTEVVLAFDMDVLNKIEVKKGIVKLFKRMQDNKIKCTQITWKEEYYKDENIKGIDDYLLINKF
ncbi:MAG: DUF3854 domain-containing protein [Clostridium sp.]